MNDDNDNEFHEDTYVEVVAVVLRRAVVALDEVVLEPEGSMGEVLLLASKDDVSRDVYSLLRVDVTDDGKFAVSFSWREKFV